jgi:hypothetical protein
MDAEDVKLDLVLQVGFGVGSSDMQSNFRMKSSGAVAITPAVPQNGLRPPAMTTLSGCTWCSTSADALTSSRYKSADTTRAASNGQLGSWLS